ncbi:MAG: hypothetical protein H0V84_00790 [Actinobacteria bacterium]|nr:hypothetical protein [Actinomycetota bacterium]
MIIARLGVAAAIAAALALPAGAAAPKPPARLQVVADEFNLRLSRQTIKAGAAIVQLANFGEDAHDLRLRRRGGTRTYVIAPTQAGETRDLSARFLAGRFALWCSLADHRERGMVATLVVAR